MASPQSTPDYYEILELEQDATVEQIRESYKRLALKLHPDRNLSPDATAQFQLLSHAYEALMRPFAEMEETPPKATSNRSAAHMPRLRAELKILSRFRAEVVDEIHELEEELENLRIDVSEEAESVEVMKDRVLQAKLAKKEAIVAQISVKKEQINRRWPEETRKQRLEEVKERAREATHAFMCKQQQCEFAERELQIHYATEQLEVVYKEHQKKQKGAEYREGNQRIFEAEHERNQQGLKAKYQQWQQELEWEYKDMQQQLEARHQKKERRRRKDFERLQRRKEELEEELKIRQLELQEAQKSKCTHEGQWPKVQGLTMCPGCLDCWDFLLKCPGCKITRCPRCADYPPRTS